MGRLGLGIVLALALSLGGCLTTEQQAARDASRDDTKCQSWGVAKGSPDYVQCRAQLEQNRSDNQPAPGLASAIKRAAE